MVEMAKRSMFEVLRGTLARADWPINGAFIGLSTLVFRLSTLVLMMLPLTPSRSAVFCCLTTS